MVPIGLVYSIHDPTEVAIQKMIEASERMIATHSQVQGEAREGWGINPVMKRHLELEKTKRAGALIRSLCHYLLSTCSCHHRHYHGLMVVLLSATNIILSM
jgi:hypothetical protein